MGDYEIPAPGVRQKKPQIVPQSSRVKGSYFAVRTFERGIAPVGHVVYRAPTREQCQAFIDNGCKIVKPASPKKQTRKKAAKK
jgi:hypothetical protein